jgi:hypothetical protein
MYQEACKKYKRWDDELNDIYGVLYEGSLAKSTKERCHVLVDKYMK